MQDPVLLTYNLDDPRAQEVRALAQSLGITVRPVPDTAHGVTLKKLLDDTSDEAPMGSQAAVKEAMIVMCHFPRPLLNALLDGFRDKGIPPVSLMAVLTPTNSTWTSADLYTALCKERAHFVSQQDKDGA